MILIIGHEASLTGAPKSLLFFSKWLKKNQKEPLCFILRNGGPMLDEYKKIGEVFLWEQLDSTHSLSRRIIRRLFRSQESQRISFLKKIKKDVSIIYNNTCTNGKILEIVKPQLNKPLVSRIPELEIVIQNYKMRGMVRSTFDLSDGIVAVSQAVKNNLITNHNIKENKIKVCYGAIPSREKSQLVNKALLRTQLGLPEDAFIVGGVGTLIWRKGYDMFIDLAIRFKSIHTIRPVYLLWVGGEKESVANIELQKQIQIHQLEDCIKFIPTTKDVYDYYQAMDVFFLSSREDPFPLANLEAAQAGLPIICFNHAGGGDELVDESLGYVVNFEDIDAVSDKIRILINDNIQRKTLSQGALERIKSFNIHDSASCIYDFISEIRSLQE